VPTQTLTFLFTDIEGSTALCQDLGDAYAEVLTDHHRIIRERLAAHGGKEVDTQGDAFFAVFSSPSACVAAAIDMQRAFTAHAWPGSVEVRVRMGIHSGEASETAVGLVGLDLHRGARVAAVAHGGQILVSGATAALVGYSMPATASLKDLGLHRLKDLGRPEQIFQLDADGLLAEFPPLRSLDNPELANNLPSSLSTFIGRQAELAEIGSLMGSSRLVTLTGPGGSGKTRLALHVAADLLDGSGDGVWFVDLAPLVDPEQVAGAVAAAVGIREQAARSYVEALVDGLRNENVLVVLDNCEHLIDASAKLADQICRSCPRVQILATSREPLGIDGEHVYRVLSLATPEDGDPLDTIRNSEAVRLFTDRATRHGVSLAWDESTASVIGRICRRLDGIPLAIELGAARLRVMSVTELDARLDQRFSLLTGGSRTALRRQQTLLAMVEWSWDLLNTAERQLLARLSVFSGGFELSAVEAVAPGQGMSLDEVVGHLGALVDKSLVQFDHARAAQVRYRLLETVRQYAASRLDDLGFEAAQGVRIAHRDHFLDLGERAAPELVSQAQAQWLDRLDLEFDNLRAAISFSLTIPDPVPGIRLVTALRMFFKARGHASEGVEALRVLLEAPGGQAVPHVRAGGLAVAAYLLEQMGGYSDAEAFAGEGLDIARSLGDDYLVADLLDVSAFVLLRRGQPGPALPLAEEGLDIARELGEPHLTARLLAVRSFALDVTGDHVGAARDSAESVRIYRQVGDQRQVGTMLGNLGYCELSVGELDAARGHLDESLEIARSLNDRYGVVYETFNLGLAEYLSDSLERARNLLRGVARPGATCRDESEHGLRAHRSCDDREWRARKGPLRPAPRRRRLCAGRARRDRRAIGGGPSRPGPGAASRGPGWCGLRGRVRRGKSSRRQRGAVAGACQSAVTVFSRCGLDAAGGSGPGADRGEPAPRYFAAHRKVALPIVIRCPSKEITSRAQPIGSGTRLPSTKPPGASERTLCWTPECPSSSSPRKATRQARFVRLR